MDKASIEKLLDAGYVFLRATNDGGKTRIEPQIKISSIFGRWQTLKVYKSKAERDRDAKALVEMEGQNI